MKLTTALLHPLATARRLLDEARWMVAAGRAARADADRARDVFARLKSVGSIENSSRDLRVLDPSKVTVGTDVYMSSGLWISSFEEVHIGDRVLFGPDCMIMGGDHDFEQLGKHSRWLPARVEPSHRIFIEDNVWCGARVIILKGVRIGMGAVVAAGSVVAKDIPPYTLAAGNPCRPLRKIFDDETLVRHLELTGYPRATIEQTLARRSAVLGRDAAKEAR